MSKLLLTTVDKDAFTLLGEVKSLFETYYDVDKLKRFQKPDEEFKDTFIKYIEYLLAIATELLLMDDEYAKELLSKITIIEDGTLLLRYSLYFHIDGRVTYGR